MPPHGTMLRLDFFVRTRVCEPGEVLCSVAADTVASGTTMIAIGAGSHDSN